MDETQVRELLHVVADVRGPFPEMPQEILRRSRRRIAATLGVTVVTVVALLVGSVTGVRSLLNASPSIPRGGTDRPSVSPIPPPEGTRVVTSTRFGVPISITLPSSWTHVDRENLFVAFQPLPSDPDAPAVGIDVASVEDVYRDPCLGPEGGLLEPPLGPTPRELLDHLLAIGPLHASAPEPVTVGGFSGLAIEEHMRSGARCVGGVALWPLNDTEAYVIFETERKRIMALDVEGRRVVVIIVAPDSMWDDVLPEAEEVLASLRFEP